MAAKRFELDTGSSRAVQCHQEPERDQNRCAATGCSLRGTIDAGSAGRYFCSCHDRAERDDWIDINAKIREHQWLVELIGDLHKHVYHPRKGQPWQEYAARFWDGHDGMAPSRDECTYPSAYLQRMHQELLHRVRGAARPQPWIAADVRAKNVAAGYRHHGSGAFSGMRSAPKRAAEVDQEAAG